MLTFMFMKHFETCEVKDSFLHSLHSGGSEQTNEPGYKVVGCVTGVYCSIIVLSDYKIKLSLFKKQTMLMFTCF